MPRMFELTHENLLDVLDFDPASAPHGQISPALGNLPVGKPLNSSRQT